MSAAHENEHEAMAQKKARKAVQMANGKRNDAIEYLAAFTGFNSIVRDGVLAAGCRVLIDAAIKERETIAKTGGLYRANHEEG